jgi:hypothetical protein
MNLVHFYFGFLLVLGGGLLELSRYLWRKDKALRGVK